MAWFLQWSPNAGTSPPNHKPQNHKPPIHKVYTHQTIFYTNHHPHKPKKSQFVQFTISSFTKHKLTQTQINTNHTFTNSSSLGKISQVWPKCFSCHSYKPSFSQTIILYKKLFTNQSKLLEKQFYHKPIYSQPVTYDKPLFEETTVSQLKTSKNTNHSFNNHFHKLTQTYEKLINISEIYFNSKHKHSFHKPIILANFRHYYHPSLTKKTFI